MILLFVINQYSAPAVAVYSVGCKVLYDSPWGNLVDCSPPAAHAAAESIGPEAGWSTSLVLCLDEFVLCRPLVELYETLHARFYLYELGLTPSGVSFYRLDAEDSLEGSNNCGP